MNINKSLKELLPEDIHFVLRIKNFIIRDLGLGLKNKKLVLGVSGGVDSMALLLIMNTLKHIMGFNIVVAHLNHQLREEANQEMEFVRTVCIENNISFFGGRSKVITYAHSKRKSIEDAARTIRYRFLEGIRKKTNSHFIVTAHHLNDLAEDVIMRIIRGVGWPDLGGMKALYWDKKILRPLILTPKNRLVKFLKNYSITWCEDSSNYDTSFRRNRVRHKIIPLFLKENPNFLNSIKNLWEMARVDEAYFNSILIELKKREKHHPQKISIAREEVLSLPKAVRIRWYRDILLRLGFTTSLFQNLINLDRCIVEFKGPRTIQFPERKVVEIRKEIVIFRKL